MLFCLRWLRDAFVHVFNERGSYVVLVYGLYGVLVYDIVVHIHNLPLTVAFVPAGAVLDANYVVVSCGQQGLVRRSITRAHLDSLYTFKGILDELPVSALGEAQLEVGDLVLHGRPAEVYCLFGFWRNNQLKAIAVRHGIRVGDRPPVHELIGSLMRHECNSGCGSLRYVFWCMSNPCHVASSTHCVVDSVTPMPMSTVDDGPTQIPSGLVAPVGSHDGHGCTGVEDCYLEVASEELKTAIIREWEQLMSMEALREHVCTSCAHRMPREMMLFVKAAKIDFSLLRNDHIPEDVLPISYNRAAYGGAILNPKGLTSLQSRADVKLCIECERSLRKGQMPKYALANWLYYGHDRLPADVQQAFKEATQVERVLVSRARGNRILFRFCETKGHYLYGTDPHTSQSYVREARETAHQRHLDLKPTALRLLHLAP